MTSKPMTVAIVIVSPSKSNMFGGIVALKVKEHLKNQLVHYPDSVEVVVPPTATQEEIVAAMKDQLGKGFRIKPGAGVIVRDEKNGVTHSSLDFKRVNDIISNNLGQYITGDQYALTYKDDRSIC